MAKFRFNLNNIFANLKNTGLSLEDRLEVFERNLKLELGRLESTINNLDSQNISKNAKISHQAIDFRNFDSRLILNDRKSSLATNYTKPWSVVDRRSIPEGKKYFTTDLEILGGGTLVVEGTLTVGV